MFDDVGHLNPIELARSHCHLLSNLRYTAQCGIHLDLLNTRRMHWISRGVLALFQCSLNSQVKLKHRSSELEQVDQVASKQSDEDADHLRS